MRKSCILWFGLDREISSAKFGEVIEAGTASFTGQCYELHRPPALGSLVKVVHGGLQVFGVVSSAQTRSIEEGRKPVARGGPASDEDVYKAHPQLAKLLCTDFVSIVVGHRIDGSLYQRLPPGPARMHGFIYSCLPDEVREFSRGTGFLRMVVSDQSPWLDEVISACLLQFSAAHENPEHFLVSAGRELAVLLGGDFHRLGNIMRRVRGK